MNKYYVYKYEHKDKGCVYIGKSTNHLDQRVHSHNNNKFDNINRDYEEILNESTIYYIELNSKYQMDAIERLLIEKYKPICNVQFKSESICNIEFTLPEWKLFSDSFNKSVYKRKKEHKQIDTRFKLFELVNKKIYMKDKDLLVDAVALVEDKAKNRHKSRDFDTLKAHIFNQYQLDLIKEVDKRLRKTYWILRPTDKTFDYAKDNESIERDKWEKIFNKGDKNISN